MKNRKYSRLIRRTAAVIGSGVAAGTALAAPIIAPVVNVYAADSYETEKTDYESKLAEAKKTTGLKVTEKTESVVVLESELEAKKKELAEKTDAETAKLQAAIDKQKANNKTFDDKTKNPSVLFDGIKNEKAKSQYTEAQVKEFLTDNSGEFNFADVNDFSFKDVTGFSSTAKAADKNKYKEMRIAGEFGLEGIDAWDQAVYSVAEADAAVKNGKVARYVSIPEKGAKYIEENFIIDNKTGKAVDAIFTLTDFSITDDAAYPVLLWHPTLGFEIGGGLKTVNFKVDFVEHGTTTPISIDIVYTATDLDGSGVTWDGRSKTQNGLEKQTFTFYNAYKNMLAKGSKVVVKDGQTASGTKSGIDDDDPEGWVSFIARDVSTINFKWDDNVSKGLSHKRWEGSTEDMSTWDIETSDSHTGGYVGTATDGDHTFTWAWIAFDGFGIISHENMPKRATSAVEVTKYEITTKADTQKGSVVYIDKSTNNQLEKKDLTGTSNQPFNYTTTDTIKKYTDMGYELVSSDYPANTADQKFDSDPKVDQNFTVVLTPKIVTIPPEKPGYDVKESDLNKTIKRTIFYKYETKDGKDVYEPITQTVKLTRSATENLVTKEITYTPWTEGKMETVESKPKTNYTYDREKVDGIDPVKSDTKVNDEYVIYNKIPQKGSVDFTDRDSKKPIADTKKLNGHNAEPFGYTPDATIKKLEDKGYDLVSNDFPKDEKDQVYDTDSKVDQDFHVVMTPHIEKIPPTSPKKPGDPARPDVPYPEGLEAKDLNKTLTRTIYYKYNSPEGEDVFEPVKQTVKLTRSATFNYVTGEIVYEPWTTGKIEDVISPKKTNYTLDRAVVEGVPEVTNKTKLEDQYVIYKKIPQKGSVDFTDKDSKQPIADTKKLNGYNAEPFNYTPDNTIQKLTDKGYDLVSNDFPKDKKDQVYDTDSKVDQDFHVVMTPHIEDITPDKPKEPGSDTDRKEVKYPEGLQAKNLNKTLSRTIYYKYNNKDGEDVFEPVKQSVKLTRTAKFNYVTGEIKYGNWTVATIKDVKSPDKENYSYDRSVVEGVPEVKVDTKLEDQYVIYKKIPQKGSVDFTDRDTKEEVNPTKKLDGYQAEPFNYTPDSTIKKLENKGWDLVSNDFPEDKKDQVYDKDSNVDQDFHVVLTPHIEVIPPEDPKAPGTPTDRDEVKYPEGVDVDDLNKTFTRTIFYKYESPEGEDVFEPVVQTVTLTRPATFNYVTGEVVYGEWTTATIEDVDSQVKEHYQFDRAVVEGVDLTSESEPLEDQYVIYTRVPEKGKMEFTDEENNPIADTHELNGFDEDPFDYDPAPVLEDLHNKGWDLVTNDYPEKPEDQVFDSDPNVDQDFKAVHTPHIEIIKPDDPKKPGSDTDRKDVKYPEGVDEADLNKTFTRTIYFKYNDKNGNDVFEPVKQEVHLTREAKFNYVTGEVEYTEWTTDTMSAVDAKTKEGYVFDRSKIDELILTGDSEAPSDEYIIYTPEPKEETLVTPVTPNVSTGSPVSPSTSLNRTSGTNTGDHSKTGLFVALGTGAAAAIAGIAAFLFKRKKREDEA